MAAMLMWNTHLAYAVERWRATHGAHVPDWLRCVGEFEASRRSPLTPTSTRTIPCPMWSRRAGGDRDIRRHGAWSSAAA